MSDNDDDKDMPTFTKEVSANLFKARTIFIYGEINQKVASRVCAELIALSTAGDGDIKVFVNSPGGHVESGDSIYDMIKFVGNRVITVGTGWVASAGALIFLGAKPENRVCLPNTRFLLHQPSGGAGGPASDIAIQAKEIIKMRERLNKIIALETGQPLEQVAKDTERDYWLSAEEAIQYGLVSKVVKGLAEIK